MRRFAPLLACLMLVAPSLQAAAIPDYIAKAVAAPERSAKDRERDARDKPAELLAFAGLKSGMTAADVFGGGGYWSEILSRAVGPTGSATLVNNEGYANFAKDDIKARFADGRLKEVKQLVGKTSDLGLGSDKYDFIMIFMSYHDIYWVDEKEGWSKIDADNFIKQLYAALKTGGKLLIVDHAAKADTGSSPRRIAPYRRGVREERLHAGFTLEKSGMACGTLLMTIPSRFSIDSRQDGPLHAAVREALRRRLRRRAATRGTRRHRRRFQFLDGAEPTMTPSTWRKPCHLRGVPDESSAHRNCGVAADRPANRAARRARRQRLGRAVIVTA
jgi:predicted methyltransferase